jgi:ABC-type Fe3+/spermidine/putrescine transport system ATPase subunit
LGLIVDRLSKRFGDHAALDRLDLGVATGEFFVLLGASGSGKTTLLRCLGGFEPPDGGRIELDGQDITALPPHRRPVNTMFQSYALFPHMSVAANIAFGLQHRGPSRAQIAARVAELLELVRLPGFGARRPAQLSGGQQQRVALARSLAPRPALLLLDEPFSALDQGLREATRQELAALQRLLGQTTIMVTHDQEEALTLATRIGVLQDGRLAQVGPPAELYERPASRYVAEFLGAANVFAVQRQGEDAQGGWIELAGLGRLRPAIRPPAGTRYVAIRPERVRLNAAGPNRLPGRITDRAYRGGALALDVALEGGGALRAVVPLRDGLGATPAMPGDAVMAGWAPEACILLPD